MQRAGTSSLRFSESKKVPQEAAHSTDALHAVSQALQFCQHHPQSKIKKDGDVAMPLQDNHAQFEQLKPRLQQVEFDHLKSRLDSAQLERTVAALHQTLPETKASEAEATLRRMYARAKRWEE
jgi:hypothetical protein